MDEYNTAEASSLALPFCPKSLIDSEGIAFLDVVVNRFEDLTPKQLKSILERVRNDIEAFLSYQATKEQEKATDYLTIKEAAEKLGKTTQTIYQRIQRGGLPKGTVVRSPQGRGMKILASRLSLF